MGDRARPTRLRYWFSSHSYALLNLPSNCHIDVMGGPSLYELVRWRRRYERLLIPAFRPLCAWHRETVPTRDARAERRGASASTVVRPATSRRGRSRNTASTYMPEIGGCFSGQQRTAGTDQPPCPWCRNPWPAGGKTRWRAISGKLPGVETGECSRR